MVLEQAVNFSLDILPVLLLVLALSERGLSIGCIWIQSIQVVIICCRKMKFGSEKISGVLGVAVHYSHISDLIICMSGH